MSGLNQGLQGTESPYNDALTVKTETQLHIEIDAFWNEHHAGVTGFTYPQKFFYKWINFIMDKIENPSNTHWA